MVYLGSCVTRGSVTEGGSKPASADARNGAIVVPQPDDVSVEGWQAEAFALPPGFAPELPTGKESLRFAPGWRDPGAEGFWSYAFVMWINEPASPALDAGRIEDLLEKYYTGLMSAFAAGKGKDISGTPVRIDVASITASRYEASMHLIDAFATYEPIDLRVLIDVAGEADGRMVLQIQVSPQPREHAIWRSLRAAIASIVAGDGVEVKAEGSAR